ncbi:LysM peptidoglycan-binding domain-containing protein [Celeribacter sp.]|uniref:LysM peptidoglycan-binding domain-containing protein n=1 Tax=Celeribacter sp. TaxID=1890673 RepID=UPI003A93FE40
MTISYSKAMLAGCAFAALSACDQPLDFDLRGLTDGFSTSQAAIEARTAPKPQADANGIISYPNYQVAIARNGDTIGSVAARTGLSTSELARYNGIPEDVTLRAGEVIALPRRVDTASPIQSGTIATGERIDVTSLASQALDEAESGTTTTQMTQADPSDPIEGMEPVRHQVQRGETAYSIARKYGISVRALADWNGLDANLSVQEGRYLLIPVKAADSATSTSEEITKPGEGSSTPTPPSAAEPLPDPDSATPVAAPSEPAADLGATQSSSAEMTKPVSGPIIRDYDSAKSKFILFSAPAGTAVKAAKAGTVKLISTNADGVKIIVIDHGAGLQTAYSFIDDISVSKGDTVKRGQQIAKVTANEFNALQFMVFKGTQTVDPTPYLN